MLGVGTLLNYASSALAVLLLRYDKLKKLPLDLEREYLLNSQNSINTTNSNCSLNQQCSKCLNLNKFHKINSFSNKSSFIDCPSDKCLLNDQSVHEPVQLIVALPSSFYYRQYYKQTFNKIKKSFSDCHLQSKICSFPSASYNQIRSTMQAPNTNANSKESNSSTDQKVIYQHDLTNLKSNSDENHHSHSDFNSPQLTSCYIDKNFSSSLEFDFNLNYLNKLPTIETEIKVKCKFCLTPSNFTSNKNTFLMRIFNLTFSFSLN